jgi:hypothetical protein
MVYLPFLFLTFFFIAHRSLFWQFGSSELGKCLQIPHSYITFCLVLLLELTSFLFCLFRMVSNLAGPCRPRDKGTSAHWFKEVHHLDHSHSGCHCDDDGDHPDCGPTNSRGAAPIPARPPYRLCDDRPPRANCHFRLRDEGPHCANGCCCCSCIHRIEGGRTETCRALILSL